LKSGPWAILKDLSYILGDGRILGLVQYCLKDPK